MIGRTSNMQSHLGTFRNQSLKLMSYPVLRSVIKEVKVTQTQTDLALLVQGNTSIKDVLDLKRMSQYFGEL